MGPISPGDPSKPTRSPSLPAMNGNSPSKKAAKILGIDFLPTLPNHTYSSDLLPSVLQRSPTAPNPVTASASSSTISKRSHLIREIAATERAYANDLALVRDAYLLHHLRPTSVHSTVDTTISPGAVSETSRRNSVNTYQSAETKRSSAHDSINAPWASGVFATPVTKISSREASPYGPMSTGMTGSVSSILSTPQLSPRNGSRTSGIYGSMPPPIGKPLSPADMKSVFLNLDQMAVAAEDLASAFEKMIGEEGAGGGNARVGESGSDRLGEAFLSMVCL